MPAFYSLVRYVDDVERGETVNVGALLWSEGQTLRKFVERDAVPDHEVVRRFDELLGYIVAHDDRGETEPGDGDEPLLFALARRRFPHFEITEPRAIAPSDELQTLLDTVVTRFVEEPTTDRLAVGRG